MLTCEGIHQHMDATHGGRDPEQAAGCLLEPAELPNLLQQHVVVEELWRQLLDLGFVLGVRGRDRVHGCLTGSACGQEHTTPHSADNRDISHRLLILKFEIPRVKQLNFKTNRIQASPSIHPPLTANIDLV
jgi:hypothetical protein